MWSLIIKKIMGHLYMPALMLLCGINALDLPLEDHWTKRTAVPQTEDEQAFGGPLQLQRGDAYELFLVPLMLTGALAVAFGNYWTRRAAILRDEAAQAIGGQLQLDIKERTVNDILMKAKNEELEEGLRNSSYFLPSQNFLKVKRQIEKSTVFKMIREMPKGGVLHSHSSAIVSDDYVFNNITYRDNLYACELGGELALKFFDKPDDECDWKLLSELRKDPDTARNLNDRIRRQLSMDHPSSAKTGFADGNSAWLKMISIYDFVRRIINYRPVRADCFYQALQELYDDNVLYLELRSALVPMYDLNGTEYPPVEVARLLRDVSNKFVQDHPKFVGVKLIYSATKINDTAVVEENFKTVRELERELPDFFVGFDLDGHEEKKPKLVDYVEKLIDIAPKISFFFHAAETKWNGMKVDENIIDAVFLNTRRIGHGFGLTKHPKILEIAKRKKIALEVSPISNQVLSLVDDLRNHPTNALLAINFPIVISNDDPALWGVKGLSYDFYEAFMGMMSAHSDIRALKQLAINSIEYSSLNDMEKKRAMALWKDQWTAFINTYNKVN